MQAHKKRVATLLGNLEGGGAERITLNLLKGMSPDAYELELLLVDATGAFVDQVPPHVTLTDLKAGGISKAVVPLARHLRRTRPDILMSHSSHINVGAVAAKLLSGVPLRTVVVEHNNRSVSGQFKQRKSDSTRAYRKLLPQLIERLYRYADAVVGVSHGVSRYIAGRYHVPAHKLHTIYNPIVDEELLAKAEAEPFHPWLREKSKPVLLAVGRLTVQKDFETLLRAFAEVRQQTECRLLILGEGEKRGELEALAQALGVADDVAMPGFTDNPYACMSRADALVLSSRWEGLPTVLVEAMACGCPVVATDCPSGPDEILEGGKWGPLVAVGDPEALAAAILKTLESPPSADLLRSRAAVFSHDNAVQAYTQLFASLS
jgi:glycosyltransferase involved in cell wall biosynthesis